MARLEVRLLGTVNVTLDGQPVGFAYDKVRALLALLCAEPDRAIPRDWAAGLLWPDEPQNAAQDSLRQALLRLRTCLAEKDNETSFLLVNRETLQTNRSSSIWVDLLAFNDLLARSAGHRHRSLPGCPTCFTWLRQAASVYRGPFLADLMLPDSDLFDQWRAGWQERLERQAVGVLDALVSTASFQGEDDLVIEWAARQVEIDPYHEPAHRQVMLALARSGKRAQAAVYYQRVRTRFQEDLGLSPAPETQALDRALRAEEAIASPFREVRNLPSPVAPLVGRAVERSELETWLNDSARRLISIIGPGGIGKTRLVIDVAQRIALAFADGGLYLSFSAQMAAGTLPRALAFALGMPVQDLAAGLRDKDLLVVLDGCEHILADREAVTGLLEAAPRLVVLAASRERLGLPGEWAFLLGGLEVPPPMMTDQLESYSAVALFEQNARQVWSGFCLTHENRPAVGEICRLVGGIPLALRLAAAWVRMLPAGEIAAQIRGSLDILAAGRDDPHASVRAVFEQSWLRLDPAEQSVFMRLAVFQDGFDREAAAQVAGASLEALARLVDSSFLRVTGENRYDLHDLLHQFATEKLLQSGQEESTRRNHFDYFFQRSRQNVFSFRGPDALKAFFWLSRESANLRSALAWAEQYEPEESARFAELTRQGIHQTGVHLLARGERKLDFFS